MDGVAVRVWLLCDEAWEVCEYLLTSLGISKGEIRNVWRCGSLVLVVGLWLRTLHVGAVLRSPVTDELLLRVRVRRGGLASLGVSLHSSRQSPS